MKVIVLDGFARFLEENRDIVEQLEKVACENRDYEEALSCKNDYNIYSFILDVINEVNEEYDFIKEINLEEGRCESVGSNDFSPDSTY